VAESEAVEERLAVLVTLGVRLRVAERVEEMLALLVRVVDCSIAWGIGRNPRSLARIRLLLIHELLTWIEPKQRGAYTRQHTLSRTHRADTAGPASRYGGRAGDSGGGGASTRSREARRARNRAGL